MNFIRHQEEQFALRVLRWKYQKEGLVEPPPDQLAAQARRIVADAHRIARERGRNVLGILKELAEEIQKGSGRTG